MRVTDKERASEMQKSAAKGRRMWGFSSLLLPHIVANCAQTAERSQQQQQQEQPKHQQQL